MLNFCLKMKQIRDLKELYEIDFDKIIREIKKKKCKLVLLQFPDGLKPYATAVVDFLESKSENVNFLIWLGDCFGACDTPILPLEVDKKIDLIVQIGHNEMMPGF
jgi:2-(3-amino-3-carboxypropyl)histidine synthase